MIPLERTSQTCMGMAEENALQSGHRAEIGQLGQSAHWLRRFSMRLGLEGKLILCFMAVLCAAMGATSIVFNNEAHDRLSHIVGEQARQVATALPLTSEGLARNGEWDELTRRGRELIKSRNIL